MAEGGSSPGCKGNSYDNTLAGSAIKLFTTEVIRQRRPLRSLEDVEFTTLEWAEARKRIAFAARPRRSPEETDKLPFGNGNFAIRRH